MCAEKVIRKNDRGTEIKLNSDERALILDAAITRFCVDKITPAIKMLALENARQIIEERYKVKMSLSAFESFSAQLDHESDEPSETLKAFAK